MFQRSEFVYLVCLTLPNLVQNIITSINGPLFPPEAEKKGLEPYEYGLVLSFFRLIFTAGGLMMGFSVEKIGLKTAFVWGTLLNGISPVLFGMLHFVNSKAVFLGFAFVLRGFEALGAAGFVIPMFMYPRLLMSGKVALTFGILQSTYLIGNSIGPMLGSSLFVALGFPGPYVIFGLLQMMIALLGMYLIPDTCEQNCELIGKQNVFQEYWQIVKSPSVLLYIFTNFVIGFGTEFFVAVLEPSLRIFSLTALQIGAVFMLMGLGQLVGPFWGYLLDSIKNTETVFLPGSATMILALMFIGPFPGIPINIETTIIGTILFGFGQGAIAISALETLRRHTMKACEEKESITKLSFVSMAYISSSGAGGAISPFIAGFLFEEIGFQYEVLVPLGLQIITGILVGYSFWLRRRSPAKSVSSSSSPSSEYDPLLLISSKQY